MKALVDPINKEEALVRAFSRFTDTVIRSFVASSSVKSAPPCRPPARAPAWRPAPSSPPAPGGWRSRRPSRSPRPGSAADQSELSIVMLVHQSQLTWSSAWLQSILGRCEASTRPASRLCIWLEAAYSGAFCIMLTSANTAN